MNKKGLILNKSYDDFILGTSVINYINRPHQIDRLDDPFACECYTFFQNGFDIELWCEDGHIDSICCRESCMYKGKELINMKYDEFMNIIQEEPLKHEVLYVPVKENWGQNQHVYDYDKSGLQVWVWRGKIRTIIIYDTNACEE